MRGERRATLVFPIVEAYEVCIEQASDLDPDSPLCVQRSDLRQSRLGRKARRTDRQSVRKSP